MASLKDLRNRISSVKSTQKITKAMQMVAASKLRRAQEAAEAARPYAERMDSVIRSLSAGVNGEGAPKLLVGTGSDKVHLVVVATTEKGYCGAFNTNIVKAARAHIEDLRDKGREVKILCIGKKGHVQLKRVYKDNIIDLIDLSDIKKVSFGDARPIGQKILSLFDEGAFDICTLFYARFKSPLVQEVTKQRLIPAALEEDQEDGQSPASPDLQGAVYEYEPSEKGILEALLPRNISVQVFRSLLENTAGEYGARMTAMDNATRNAGEVIDGLTQQYNRTRQAAITTELTEIISGAEAL